MEYHRVGGLLYELLRPWPADDPLAASLRRIHDGAVSGHLRILWELARLKPVLDATGYPWAVIKGPVLVDGLYGSAGARPYADLDLLVDPAGFRDVLAALQQVGGRVVDRNWTALRRDLRGQVHVLLPGDVPLDVHWNLVNMYRRAIRIDTPELLARGVEVNLGGLIVRTLDATDAVLHLALHAGLSGGDRLIWLKDIERSAAIRPPSWELAVDRARQWRIAGVVGLMLARARDVLDARIPGPVLQRLISERTRRLIRAVDRAAPWELSMGRLSAPNVVLSRGIVHGLAGGSRWFLERTVRGLDPREPAATSAFTPSGGDPERDAYLDAIAVRGANPHGRRRPE